MSVCIPYFFNRKRPKGTRSVKIGKPSILFCRERKKVTQYRERHIFHTILRVATLCGEKTLFWE